MAGRDITSNYAAFLDNQRAVLRRAQDRVGQKPQWNSRGDMIADHERFALQTRLALGVISGNHMIQQTFIPPAYPPCIQPLDKLKKIMRKDLKVETHHRGSYIALKSISTPARMTAIMSICEDENGECVMISLYMMEPEHKRTTMNILPRGQILIIKEPYLKVPVSDKGFTMRVDHLSDVLFLDEYDGRVPEKWRKPKEGMKAGYMKEVGNAALKKKQYHEAVQFYTRGLLAPDLTEELSGVIRLNRSQAYLFLEKYDAALDDVGPLFNLKDSKLLQKVVYRAAQAQYNLRRFDVCMTTLSAHEDDEDFAGHELLGKVKKRLHERGRRNVRGGPGPQYDFAAMRKEVKALKEPYLDHATYDSTVEVKNVPGKGRGLFLTHDVKTGDTVLCEKAYGNAFARSKDEATKSPIIIDTNSQRVTAGHHGQLVDLIAQKLQRNPSQLDEVYQLAGKGYIATGVTRVHEADGPQPVLDTFRIYSTIDTNAFSNMSNKEDKSDSKLSLEDKGTEQSLYGGAGLFVKASYINHSCLGNCRRSFIGDFIVVTVSGNLKKGTELVMPYMSAMSKTQKNMDETLQRSWGFKCACELCCAERELAGNARYRTLEREIARCQTRNDEGEITHLRADTMGKKLLEMAALTSNIVGKIPMLRMSNNFEVLVGGFALKEQWTAVVDFALMALEVSHGFEFFDDSTNAGKNPEYRFMVLKMGMPSIPALYCFIMRLREAWSALSSKSGISENEKETLSNNFRAMEPIGRIIHKISLWMIGRSPNAGTVRYPAKLAQILTPPSGIFISDRMSCGGRRG